MWGCHKKFWNTSISHFCYAYYSSTRINRTSPKLSIIQFITCINICLQEIVSHLRIFTSTIFYDIWDVYFLPKFPSKQNDMTELVKFVQGSLIAFDSLSSLRMPSACNHAGFLKISTLTVFYRLKQTLLAIFLWYSKKLSIHSRLFKILVFERRLACSKYIPCMKYCEGM